MICKNCKNEIDDNSLFCKYCGKPQKRTAKTEKVSVPKARQLKSGAWNIELRKEGVSVTAATEKECTSKAIAIRSGYIRAEKKAPITYTVSKAIDDHITGHTTLSPESIRGYRNIQRNRFKNIMNKPVRDITDSMMQAAINAESAEYSPKTVINAYSLICRAVGKRYDVILPQKKKAEKAYLNAEQIKVFCNALKSEDIKIAIPALLGLSSMRKSEILGLSWEDVNLKERYLVIRNVQVFDENNQPVTKDIAKNECSNRIVPIMSNQLYEALISVKDKSGRVCTVTGAVLYKNINRICAQNNLPLIGIHGLRHSFASLAASADVNLPIATTMRIGGWSTDSTLKKVYTHVYDTDIKNSQNAVADFFNN